MQRSAFLNILNGRTGCTKLFRKYGTGAKKKKRKKKLDQGAIVLQVGGRVLRQNKRSQQRKGGKLDPDFFTFTFMHLADAFIQSDLQYIQVINILSVCVFPGN